MMFQADAPGVIDRVPWVQTLHPRRLSAHMRRRLGGRRRAEVVLLFACVLGLDTANLASIGAVAHQLKMALHLTNMDLGMLAAAPALCAAVLTIPFGVAADRVPRRPVLAGTVALWAVAMAAAAASSSFTMLVVRIFLGAATAASGPLVASLIGDLFAPGERGRIFGFVVAGELLGTLVGLLVAGNLAALSWRAGLAVLALPCVALAVLVARVLPEPRRGGADRLVPTTPQEGAEAEVRPKAPDAKPIARAVLRSDPARMPTLQAIAYVLRIVTNDVLIAASSLGYFFQAGVNTFGVVFLSVRFGLGQSEATTLLALVATGALAGTILGGRVADRLLARGHASARLAVGGTGFVVSTLIFIPGLLTSSLAVAVPLYFLGALFLAMPNAALDAARLDIVPATLRGRAEAVRTVLRTLAVAAAPLIFGYLADQLAPGARTNAGQGAYSVSAGGLRTTFLVMLAPMALGGAILLAALPRYARDVATARASERAISARRKGPASRSGKARSRARRAARQRSS
jgi:MFS family permease